MKHLPTYLLKILVALALLLFFFPEAVVEGTPWSKPKQFLLGLSLAAIVNLGHTAIQQTCLYFKRS